MAVFTVDSWDSEIILPDALEHSIQVTAPRGGGGVNRKLAQYTYTFEVTVGTVQVSTKTGIDGTNPFHAVGEKFLITVTGSETPLYISGAALNDAVVMSY